MGRLWTIANVAEAFHVTPYQAALELDQDAAQLSIVCLEMLRYADAHAAYRAAAREPGRGGKEILRRFKSTPGGARLMALVEENDCPKAADSEGGE